MPYTVSTPVFEGPFDLLLQLITREQVDLWEVSLASIVDAYVTTLAEMQAALDLDVATEFLLIAAILLELKSRKLLPGRQEVELDEELALWEQRDLLLSRLLECKTFKDAAGALSRLMDNAARSHPRSAGLEEPFIGLVPDLLSGITAGRLRDVMQAVGTLRPGPRVAIDHVAPVRLSVAEAVEEVARELASVGRTSFAHLAGRLAGRLEVIVRFLAVLELYKQGRVDLEQAGTFAELHVTWVAEPVGRLEEPEPTHEVPAEEVAVEEYQG